MIALLRDADRTWMTLAACRNHDADLWYPRTVPSAEALAICGSCRVREACADYAIGIGEQHGVWGGLNAEQRRRQAREREASRG